MDALEGALASLEECAAQLATQPWNEIAGCLSDPFDRAKLATAVAFAVGSLNFGMP